MQVDFSHAEPRPTPNFWAGYDQRDFIVVHATASGDGATEYVPDFSEATGKSTHYAIAMDGHVVQYVEEKNSAWGNCCVDGNSSFRTGYNWNKSTVSIENEKHSTDNSTALTSAQYASLLLLVRDIAKRWHIPLVHGSQGTRGIIFHHDLMPIEKARCPGEFPYTTFFQDLQKGAVMPLVLDKDGCVVTVTKSFQLEPGESGDLCGPWSVIAVNEGYQPGGKPVSSGDEIDRMTDTMVDAVFKPQGINHINFPGVNPTDMINLLTYARDHIGGLIHWYVIPANLACIRAAIRAGYPVIISCNEADVSAWSKDKNAWEHAYPWQLSAGHVFPATGIDNMDNLICPDQLNNSYQGYWPVIYNASGIANSLSWACVVKLPFLKDIPNGNPLSWPAGFNAQNFTGLKPLPTEDFVLEAAVAEWNSTTTGAPFDTGIAKAWLADFRIEKFHGPPLAKEEAGKTWSGEPIVIQRFSGGRYEWLNGNPHFYSYQ